MDTPRRLNEAELNERLRNITLLVLDVDGVLTDGRITYTDTGKELKSFSVKDGQGISYWNQQPNRHSAIITARTSDIVERRAGELGIAHAFMNEKKKLARLDNLLLDLGLDWPQVAYMGDDWPDMGCLQKVGLATCPADAVTEVSTIAHWQSSHNGGHGAVRELIQHLLHAQGLLPTFK